MSNFMETNRQFLMESWAKLYGKGHMTFELGNVALLPAIMVIWPVF